MKEMKKWLTYYKRPLLWALAYIGVIVVFAFIYRLLPEKHWEGVQMTGCLDYFYFSVVTITSLGFGDIFPAAGTVARFFVGFEAVLGILFIGFFLNDVAMSQTKQLEKNNKEKEECERKAKAIEKLKKYRGVLTPMMEKYLYGAFEVITPLENRGNNFPDEIFKHDFAFEFKDLQGMYSNSLLMTNDFDEPVVFVHFRNQDEMYYELRNFVTNADLSFWSELEGKVFQFISQHRGFQYKDAIVSNFKKVTTSDKMKLTVQITKMIAEHDGELKFWHSNMLTPYEVFYEFLRNNIAAVLDIHRMINEEIEKAEIQQQKLCRTF